MRMTHATIQVARALLADPSARHWGYALTKSAGVRSGVLYPILARMLDEGWLTDGWETSEETGGKRPPRRYYEITSLGLARLGAMRTEAQRDARFGHVRWGLA